MEHPYENHSNMTERDVELMRIGRNNALLRAIDAISGSNARRAYADCGITFERDGCFNIVRYNGVSVAHMTPTFSRQALYLALLGNLRSAAEYIASIVEPQLKEKLVLPPGHIFQFDVKHECSFVESIGSNKVSAYVHLYPSNAQDENQITAEFRIFLDAPRAILFFYRGKPFYGQHYDLLNNKQAHPRAETYQELVAVLIDTFNQVCSPEAIDAPQA